MASIDKRGKVWRARVRIRGFAPKTRSFDTKAEAEQWAARIERQLLAGEDTCPDLASEMTLSEALERYAKEVTPTKKGAEQELRRIRAWQKRPLASLKLSLLTAAHFSEFKKERENEGKSANTIRLDLMLISAVFKKARKAWGMPYLKNPIAGVELPGGSKWRDRRLDEAEAQRFHRALAQQSDEMFKLIVTFALETAARLSEILRLRRTDLHVRRRIAILRDTKNGENRGVPLSKCAVEVVERALSLHDGERVFPMTRVQLYRSWRKLCDSARIENFRFHDLRHEATSRLLERGLTVMEVQRITGHKTLAMLLRYTQMYDNHVVARLDETEDSGAPSGWAPLESHGEEYGTAHQRPIATGLVSNVVMFPSCRRRL